MKIDLYQKSSELLEKIANSIIDREPNTTKPIFFNVAEIQVTEAWLKELLIEMKNME